MMPRLIRNPARYCGSRSTRSSFSTSAGGAGSRDPLAVQGGEPSRRARLAARPEADRKGLETIAPAEVIDDGRVDHGAVGQRERVLIGQEHGLADHSHVRIALRPGDADRVTDVDAGMPHGLGAERDLVGGPRLVPTNDREVRRTRYRPQREAEHRMPIDAQRELRGGFDHVRDIRVVSDRVDVADVDTHGVEDPAVQRRRVDEMVQGGSETENAHDTRDRGRGRHDRGAGGPARSVRERPTEADGARDMVAEKNARARRSTQRFSAAARRYERADRECPSVQRCAPDQDRAHAGAPSPSNWRPVLVSDRRAMPMGMKPDAT